MENSNRMIKKGMLFISVISILFGCKEEQEITMTSKNLNALAFEINDQSWEPSAIDDCTKTFMCNMSKLDDKPIYKIEAYRDPQGKTSLSSTNIFVIQITNVTQDGTFAINGSAEGFESYARFRVNENDHSRTYQNKANSNSFQVELNTLSPVLTSELVGIKGSFYGTLYNVEDPGDSIVIKKGDFTFRKLNWYNFNQCE